MSWNDAENTSKVMIVFAIIFFVSLGLCGLTLSTGLGDAGLGILEILLMLVSLGGIIITLIVALARKLFRHQSGPQTLFGKRNEDK